MAKSVSREEWVLKSWNKEVTKKLVCQEFGHIKGKEVIMNQMKEIIPIL